MVTPANSTTVVPSKIGSAKGTPLPMLPTPRRCLPLPPPPNHEETQDNHTDSTPPKIHDGPLPMRKQPFFMEAACYGIPGKPLFFLFSFYNVFGQLSKLLLRHGWVGHPAVASKDCCTGRLDAHTFSFLLLNFLVTPAWRQIHSSEADDIVEEEVNCAGSGTHLIFISTSPLQDESWPEIAEGVRVRVTVDQRWGVRAGICGTVVESGSAGKWKVNQL